LPDGVLLLLNGSSTVEAVVGQEGAVADLVQDACQITMTHPQWTAHRGKIVGRRKEFRYLGWSPFIQYAKAPTVLSITRWLRDQQHESWN
jgi:hypothetical protein